MIPAQSRNSAHRTACQVFAPVRGSDVLDPVDTPLVPVLVPVLEPVLAPVLPPACDETPPEVAGMLVPTVPAVLPRWNANTAACRDPVNVRVWLPSARSAGTVKG